MSEMDKAMFWAFGWMGVCQEAECQKAGGVSVRMRMRLTWAVNRLEREERARYTASGPRCPFCERPGHNEDVEACPDRVRQVIAWQLLGMYCYPRPEGGAA